MKLYEMSTQEFKEQVGVGTLALIPYGIIEEHGPHLPMGTDTIQAIHMVDMLAAALEERGVKTLVLPPVHYGQATSTLNFPGSISLRPSTLKVLSYDILSELVRNGVENIVVLSGHAGSQHMKAIERAAHQLVHEKEKDLNIMVLSDYFLAYELLGNMGIPEGDGHAGTIETARVHEARPELIKKEKMKDIAPSKQMPRFRILKNPERYIPSGVIGLPPIPESLGMGKEINRVLLEKLTTIIMDMLENPE